MNTSSDNEYIYLILKIARIITERERERDRWKYKYDSNNDGSEGWYHFLSNLHTWNSRLRSKTETRVEGKKFGTRENLFVHHRLRRRLIRYALTNSHEETPKNFGSTMEHSCCVHHYALTSAFVPGNYRPSGTAINYNVSVCEHARLARTFHHLRINPWLAELADCSAFQLHKLVSLTRGCSTPTGENKSRK